MAEQLHLCPTWSETPKTGFLTTRLFWELGQFGNIYKIVPNIIVRQSERDVTIAVLRFYDPLTIGRSYRAWSVIQATLLLGQVQHNVKENHKI